MFHQFLPRSFQSPDGKTCTRLLVVGKLWSQENTFFQILRIYWILSNYRVKTHEIGFYFYGEYWIWSENRTFVIDWLGFGFLLKVSVNSPSSQHLKSFRKLALRNFASLAVLSQSLRKTSQEYTMPRSGKYFSLISQLFTDKKRIFLPFDGSFIRCSSISQNLMANSSFNCSISIFFIFHVFFNKSHVTIFFCFEKKSQRDFDLKFFFKKIFFLLSWCEKTCLPTTIQCGRLFLSGLVLKESLLGLVFKKVLLVL